jgi:hypothetical protein
LGATEGREEREDFASGPRATIGDEPDFLPSHRPRHRRRKGEPKRANPSPTNLRQPGPRAEARSSAPARFAWLLSDSGKRSIFAALGLQWLDGVSAAFAERAAGCTTAKRKAPSPRPSPHPMGRGRTIYASGSCLGHYVAFFADRPGCGRRDALHWNTKPPHPVPLPIRWGEGEPFTRLVAVCSLLSPIL